MKKKQKDINSIVTEFYTKRKAQFSIQKKKTPADQSRAADLYLFTGNSKKII